MLINLLQESCQAGIRDNFECEVFSTRYLPLAYSARCFSARSENKAKDNYEYCCIKYPQGRKMKSQEEQQVFVLNGIQTLSGYQYNLNNELPTLDKMGVDIARISADSLDAFYQISQISQINHFKAQLITLTSQPLDGIKHCNGFWHNIAGMSVA